MARLGKYLSLCLVTILTVTSLLMVIPTNAQTIPKPSVPKFALQYFDQAYETKYGFFVEGKSIQVLIKNQGFTGFNDMNGNIVRLCYNIRWKEHSQQAWHPYSPDDSWVFVSDSYPASNSTGFSEIVYTEESLANLGVGNLTAGRQIDFQVKALIGYRATENGSPAYNPNINFHFEFIGEKSDWSSTQTITILTTNTPNPSPTVSEFPTTAILIAILSVASLLLVVGKRKQILSH